MLRKITMCQHFQLYHCNSQLKFSTRVVDKNEDRFLFQVAQLRARAYYSTSNSRYVSSMIKTFQLQELRALKLRLKKDYVCIVALTPQDLVIGNLDIEQQNARYFIHNVVVDEAYRRQGIARTLMTAAENKIQELTPQNVRICTKVEAQNTAALNLYYDLGFQETGESNSNMQGMQIGKEIVLQKIIQ
eukprot:TRINITY_DN3412_c0_g2_i1.p4 TRINITY_DN3412_c0_g2~~TRINITY_DN3412_c0_g2_i1.p4  ORF type:complete len:188 (-),score=9.21 TRINITY_DN3412_c0_g2_i1:669-1232(-)